MANFNHMAATRSTPLPEIDLVSGPLPGSAKWPYCTHLCERERNDRVCPLITQYCCASCRRIVAYLTHGLNSRIKRRFYGETKITHLWPSFSDEDSLYCAGCARQKYPNIEAAVGKSFEAMWKVNRNYDHTADTHFT